MYFDKKLCFFEVEESSTQDVLTSMSKIFLEQKIVKETFLDGILTREATYPTGLMINDVGFAIPHTDSIHVNESQICFFSLKNPVEFGCMVDQNEIIKVNYVFMLAMKAPHEQLENLQHLMALFQSDEANKKLKAIKTTEGFLELLKQFDIQ